MSSAAVHSTILSRSASLVIKWSVGILAALLFVSITAPVAQAEAIGLGQAGNYAVLGLDSVTAGTAINASNVTINGSVGVSHLSTLSNMAPSTINGTVYYQDAGSVSGPGHFNGTPATFQQSMTQAVTDAFNANTQNALLPATQTVSGNITTGTTFFGNGGLNVIDVNGGISLNNNNITLHGSASDVFVVNVTGDLSLTGTASLLLDGVATSHVLYNFTGGTSAHHGSFDTHVGDVVYGTMLAPFYDMNLDGTWHGELIGGPLSIGLLSGAIVTEDSFTPGPGAQPTPEPATIVTLLSMSVAACIWNTARRRCG